MSVRTADTSNVPEHGGSLSRRELLRLMAASAAAALLPGCSLFVMAGKMIQGDPKQTCKFHQMTNIDLTKDKKKVMVICSTPESIDGSNPNLKFDLADGITRRMKRRKIEVVDPDRVSDWLDRHGSLTGPNDIVQDIDADYLAVIEIMNYSTVEENSPKLHRGRTLGEVRVYKVEKVEKQKFAAQIFVTEFTSTYPEFQPISEFGRSAETFEKEYRDRVCDELAKTFYDFRQNDTL